MRPHFTKDITNSLIINLGVVKQQKTPIMKRWGYCLKHGFQFQQATKGRHVK